MSQVDDALRKIREVKRTAEVYIGYDAMAGGLISESVERLAEMEELLKRPSPDNLDKCLENLDSFIRRFSPYRRYASEMIDKISSCKAEIEKAKENM